MNTLELKEFLDQKVSQYNCKDFIATDPIQIPHRFTHKEDIEIAAFLTATIAWGNRKSIIKNATRMIEFMHESPFTYILSHERFDPHDYKGFVHRTFNAQDFSSFLSSLKYLYSQYGSLENVFKRGLQTGNMQDAIHFFKHEFFKVPHLERTRKHVSDPARGSAAKRINISVQSI